ncbi:8-amino-7-oxononanoate synthase [Candidatus Nitrospira bockiana]
MFEDHLRQLKESHLLRHLRVVGSAPGPVTRFDGRSVVLLASNDYLGLAADPRLKEAAICAVREFGVGTGASRLLCGTLVPHADLEQALAAFKETEAALVFSSGYAANLGLIPALVRPGDLVLADRLCHASLLDGCRLSGARLRVFRHNDVAHLDELLARHAGPRPALIVTEGVFSMDGDAASLPEIVECAERRGALLLVDDAHGTGVMGAHGRGTIEHFGLTARIPFHMGTLSKAIGASGGYVAGDRSFIDYVINTARSFIYSTAPPPSIAAAATEALRLLQAEPERRARLWANRAYLHDGLRALGFQIPGTVSPILPVIIGDARLALRFADRLLAHGIYAPAIRPPTVPKSTSRIRVSVTASHTREHLDAALAAFQKAGQELGLLH